MKRNYATEGSPSWQTVLPVLRQLSAELDGGIHALARQDLDEFEKHVAAQGRICDLLLETKFFTPTTPRRPATVAARETFGKLDHQKRVLAALTTRASRFVNIMQALHQSHRGYSAKGTLPIEGNTWSSEV